MVFDFGERNATVVVEKGDIIYVGYYINVIRFSFVWDYLDSEAKLTPTETEQIRGTINQEKESMAIQFCHWNLEKISKLVAAPRRLRRIEFQTQ